MFICIMMKDDVVVSDLHSAARLTWATAVDRFVTGLNDGRQSLHHVGSHDLRST